MSWFGNCLGRGKRKTRKNCKNVQKKLCYTDVKYVEKLYEDAVRAKFDNICENDNHPLHKCFMLLSHGVRMRVPSSRMNRLRDDFVTSAISFYNSN